MLSLCGFPTGSLQKFYVTTLSLCGFSTGSLQKFYVHDVVLIQVPNGFPPEILRPRCCPYAGSQRLPSTNLGAMMLSLRGFPAGSLHKSASMHKPWGHDVVLMRVPLSLRGFPAGSLHKFWGMMLPLTNPIQSNVTSTQHQNETPANATKPIPKESFDNIWSTNQLHSTSYLTKKFKSHSLKIKNSVSNQNQHQIRNRTKSNETTSKCSPTQSAPTQFNPIQSYPNPHPTKSKTHIPSKSFSTSKTARQIAIKFKSNHIPTPSCPSFSSSTFSILSLRNPLQRHYLLPNDTDGQGRNWTELCILTPCANRTKHVLKIKSTKRPCLWSRENVLQWCLLLLRLGDACKIIFFKSCQTPRCPAESIQGLSVEETRDAQFSPLSRWKFLKQGCKKLHLCRPLSG